ncbi:hypothetical protein [Microbacterium paulum]
MAFEDEIDAEMASAEARATERAQTRRAEDEMAGTYRKEFCAFLVKHGFASVPVYVLVLEEEKRRRRMWTFRYAGEGWFFRAGDAGALAFTQDGAQCADASLVSTSDKKGRRGLEIASITYVGLPSSGSFVRCEGPVHYGADGRRWEVETLMKSTGFHIARGARQRFPGDASTLDFTPLQPTRPE